MLDIQSGEITCHCYMTWEYLKNLGFRDPSKFKYNGKKAGRMVQPENFDKVPSFKII